MGTHLSITTTEALLKIRPEAEWILTSDELSTIEWLKNDKNNNGIPTEVEVESARESMQSEYDAEQYQRDRVEGTGSMYPSTGEQLDMLYHELETSGSLTISGSWFNVVKAVKDANPKP